MDSRLAVPFSNKEKEIARGLTNEFIYAIQDIKYPPMPIKIMEYEAYG